MGNQRNVDNTRRGYAAFASGDMDTLRELFSPDIVWHVAGNGILSGDYKGIDEVFAMFARLAQETEGKFKLDVHDVLANDEHGVALVRVTLERNGQKYEGNSADVFHIDGEGRVTEYWGFNEDQARVDEVFS